MVIGLKTVKGTKQLKLDPSIHDSLQVGRARRRWEGKGLGLCTSAATAGPAAAVPGAAAGAQHQVPPA